MKSLEGYLGYTLLSATEGFGQGYSLVDTRGAIHYSTTASHPSDLQVIESNISDIIETSEHPSLQSTCLRMG